MKVEVIKEEKKTERRYPYLGEGTPGLVVLFSEPKKGVVLKCKIVWNIGDYYEEWKEEDFTPLEGKITLQND